MAEAATTAADEDAVDSDSGAVAQDSPEAQDDALVDKTQKAVLTVVSGTARWVDGFFGGSELQEQPNVSFGRLNVGVLWDERDGAKERVRFKARIALPALEERARLVVGRGDVNDFVDGTDSDMIDRLPDSFNDIEDENFFLGFDFSRGRPSSGFDLGVGVSFSDGVSPYVKATYRWNHAFNDRTLLRLRPRVFWQEERGTGGSITGIFDYVVNQRWMLRSWNIAKAEDEIEGMGWTAKLIAYQNVAKTTAFAYSLYATGETENEVELQDYGIELRFRRRISRDWLFMELSTSVGWPREFVDEVRESNIGVGLEFELQFGDWPARDRDAASSLTRK